MNHVSTQGHSHSQVVVLTDEGNTRHLSMKARTTWKAKMDISVANVISFSTLLLVYTNSVISYG